MTEDEQRFWRRAVTSGLPWFRWFRRPLTVAQLDVEFEGTSLKQEWLALKAQMQSGDQIWPFRFYVRKYLGMRSGYVVLRRGRPIGGLVTIVS